MMVGAESTTPLVSVVCATFNHERFIETALQGILSQQTTFPIEVIVHDDASTDSTPEIVRRYAEMHPDIIVPILQTENQYSKGVRPFWGFMWPRARGRYIAACEGDDFWTDPDKLAKQVHALEATPSASACCHSIAVCDEDGSEIEPQIRFPRGIGRLAQLGDLLEGNFIATCSVMFRAGTPVPFPSWAGRLRNGDWVLHVLNATRGDVLCMNEVMATYRKHSGGQWTARTPEQRLADFDAQFSALMAFDSESHGRYHSEVVRGIATTRLHRAVTAIAEGKYRLARGDAWFALRHGWRLRRVPFAHVVDVFVRAFAPRGHALISGWKRSVAR